MSTKLVDSLECLLVFPCSVKWVKRHLQQQWPNKGKTTKGSNVSGTPIGYQSVVVLTKGEINIEWMVDE